MGDSMMITSAVDQSMITALVSPDQPRLYVVNNDEEHEIALEEYIGELSFPAQLSIKHEYKEKDLGSAGLVVVPIEGGGRGPIINYGESITLSMLFGILSGALTKAQLSSQLLSYLSRIPDTIPNTKEQCGYAAHNEVVTLDHNWSGYPPVIELDVAPGSTLGVIQTQVGIDPDCITYIEVPSQETIYGHSGITNNNQFTIKAAFLEKSSPVLKTLNWFPASITGPPLNVLTTTSTTTNTTVNCMGLRIKGKVGLSTNLVHEVSGAMYAQVSVDNGSWVNIGVIHWNFKDGGITSAEEKFDVIMVYDHASHNYKFRGQLIVNSDDEPDRELTGYIRIDTVSEFGSGAVISNDLLIKWASKEKL